MLLAPTAELVLDDVRLRRFQPEDAEAFGAFMAEPENTRFMTFPEELKNREAGIAIVHRTIENYEEPGSALALAVCDSSDRHILGACGAFERDAERIEIFYLVFEDARRRGVAGRSARLLTDHLRSAHPGSELIAFVHPQNEASRKILRGLGFVDVGSWEGGGLEGRQLVLSPAH